MVAEKKLNENSMCMEHKIQNLDRLKHALSLGLANSLAVLDSAAVMDSAHALAKAKRIAIIFPLFTAGLFGLTGDTGVWQVIIGI